jgi:hypothetical protein
MYPLPPELSAKIFAILGDDYGLEGVDHLHDQIAVLLVRENRRVRQQVAKLMRDFAEAADRQDGDYGDIRAAAGGEFCCEHIINKIIKPRIHSKQAEKQQDVVERLIQDFFEEDDDV